MMKTFSAKATLSKSASKELFSSRESTRKAVAGVLKARSNRSGVVTVGGYTLRTELKPAKSK